MQTMETVEFRRARAPLCAVGRLLISLALAQWAFGAVQAGEARPAPAWVRQGIIYEIFPRQFSATGDFNGITAQLDRLQQLGVDILWLMPIHPVGRLKAKGTFGSPYAVRDYYGINPQYGTASDLHRLIGAAHRRGLKVIIDVVANHTAWDSVLMKMPDFYVHDAAGHIVPPQPDWTDVARLNYGNPRLRRYMIDMLRYWVRDFDLDGFRCDAAGMVPTDFWEQARTQLDAVKPGLLMLAEWDSPALLARAFDVDYAWKGYAAVADAIQGRVPASAVREQWQRESAAYEHGALRMRFSDNHDESRAIARFGEPAALAASALMFTLDGVPLIYNGMEVGDTTESGAPALFEKLPVIWNIAERRPQFARTYRQLTTLRHSNPALSDGELVWMQNSDEARVLSFIRRDAGESLLVAVNLSSQPFSGTIEAVDGSYTDITPAPDGAASTHAASLPALSLAAWEYRVFRKQP
jgi:cyclomaltodextrinase / maltogenic alpha-amylase / neopullulanase